MATVLERIAPRAQKKPEAGTVHWFNQCIERGKRERFSDEVIVTPGLANDANQVTNAEVRARVETDERIRSSASFAGSHHKATRNFAAPAIIGFCHYVLTAEHPGDASAYMTQICTGEGLKKNDPAYVVRDRLLSLGRNRAAKMEIILRGWNAYRGNRSLKLVKWLGNFPALV
jgi:hypothetical protein